MLSYSQPKGIFIPLYHDSGELKEAIANGAIAALWEDDKALPNYMPNHFSVFYANDLWKGLKNMLEKYHRNCHEVMTREIIHNFYWRMNPI